MIIIPLLFISRVSSQSISISYNDVNDLDIYNSSGYNNQFYWPHQSCCTPPNLLNIIASSESIQIIISLDQYILTNQYQKAWSHGYKMRASLIQNSDSTLILQNNCTSKQTSYIQTGMVQFELNVQNVNTNSVQQLRFSYWLICQYEGNEQKIDFDWTMVFIIILGCLCVAFFSKMAKIRSIKIKISNPIKNPKMIKWFAVQSFQVEEENQIYFQGLRVNWIFFIIYLIATALFFIIAYFLKNIEQTIFQSLCCILSLFCGYFWINEILCIVSANFRLQMKLIGYFRLCDLISLLLSILITTLYLVLHQPWYLSTIMAFCISGTSLRLFKVTNFRGLTLLYGLIIIFDIIYYFIILTLTGIQYELVVLEYSNYPVLFELPQFKFNQNKICSWLSVFDLLIPGLAVAYLFRFDRTRNTRVYFLIGLLGLFFGTLIWILCVIAVSDSDVQLPQSLFVLPIITVFTCLWAFKQGDLRILWHGQFYDKFLMDNFEQYSDNTTQEQLNQQNLQEDQLKELLKGLKLKDEL